MSKGADIIDVINVWAVWLTVWIIVKRRRWVHLPDTGRCARGCSQCSKRDGRELSIATMQSKSFFEGMNLLNSILK